MATLQQLQDMKTDVDSSLASAASESVRVTALVAAVDALPVALRTASTRSARRTLADRAAHLAYVQMLASVRSRFLAGEISRVQLGGSSSVPVPTLPTDVGARRSVQPVVGRPS